MNFYLLELHPPCWNPPGQESFGPAPPTGGWRLFAECVDDDGSTCDLLFSDPADFERRTVKEFRAFLTWLYEAGKGGAGWQSIFQDGKLFHPVHSVTVSRPNAQGKPAPMTVQVMQWKKKRTDVRLLFVQSGLGHLNIFISHAFEKASPTTPTSEQRRAELNVTAFFKALDAGKLLLITSQGGQHATPQFN